MSEPLHDKHVLPIYDSKLEFIAVTAGGARRHLCNRRTPIVNYNSQVLYQLVIDNIFLAKSMFLKILIILCGNTIIDRFAPLLFNLLTYVRQWYVVNVCS